MSKSKKMTTDMPKQQEPPAHRLRREVQLRIDNYVGEIDESEWDSDEDDKIVTFEPLKRRKDSRH